MAWLSIKFPEAIRKTTVSAENQILSAEIEPVGHFPVIDQGQTFIAGYSDAEDRVIRDDLPIVIFGDHTRCVKYVDFPFILGADGTKVLKPKEDLFDPKFFYYALLSLEIPNRGYNRHFTVLKEKIVPRPERLRSVPYADYFDELLKGLKASINTIAQEYAWKQDDTVRIVFHIFKPLKHVEADVVGRLVESFPQFKILFAFITISTEHPWMMFRDAAEKDGRAKVVLCERGDNLILDSHNCLLQIRGDRDRANKKQRPPYLVSIRVHEKSTYKDLKFIAQQIHDFAYLSWRSFFPAETPVTVFYSSLIASESSKLSKFRAGILPFLIHISDARNGFSRTKTDFGRACRRRRTFEKIPAFSSGKGYCRS